MTTAKRRSGIEVQPTSSPSSMIMVRDEVRMGVGIGRLPIVLVGQDLTAGRLVPLGDVDGPKIALWTLYPSRQLRRACV